MGKVQCKEKAVIRYTWPGKDEAVACIEHANGISALAKAMRLYLQMIPMTTVDINMYLQCSSITKETE